MQNLSRPLCVALAAVVASGTVSTFVLLQPNPAPAPASTDTPTQTVVPLTFKPEDLPKIEATLVEIRGMIARGEIIPFDYPEPPAPHASAVLETRDYN